MISWILGAGFVVLAIVGLVVEVTARVTKRPTVGELMGIIVAARTGRFVMVALWVWVGWHFLAR